MPDFLSRVRMCLAISLWASVMACSLVLGGSIVRVCPHCSFIGIPANGSLLIFPIISGCPKNNRRYIEGMKKADRGRPPKKPEDRRENRLVVKLTDDERELLEAASGEDAVTVWARDILVRAAKRANKK